MDNYKLNAVLEYIDEELKDVSPVWHSQPNVNEVINCLGLYLLFSDKELIIIRQTLERRAEAKRFVAQLRQRFH